MILELDMMNITDKYIYAIIQTKITESGGELCISYSRLANDIGCHKNTVWASCKRLRLAGVITVVGRGVDGHIYKLGNYDC
jgi:DNA-binding Lrp family transcriptional regulator